MIKQPAPYYVDRLCKTEDENAVAKLLEEFRQLERYVLLGEPGAGKTTAFKHEATAGGSECCYVEASEFIDYDEKDEWKEKTLFIDGLDEIIAVEGNRTPLNFVRSKLNKLKVQRYRISCREADWTGERDKKSLASAMGDVTILHLQSLSDQDIKEILSQDERVPDADAFLEKADTYQLTNLLQNPQTLDMLINATQGGNEWPSSKKEVYELACIELSKEDNEEHIIGNQNTGFLTDTLLDAAGYLYVIQLIANAREFSTVEAESAGVVSLKQLKISNNEPHYAVLKTRLFNHISHQRYAPVHRSIGEFLAARYMAQALEQGLSQRRTMSLVTGFDGGVVAALRGLYAWLCTLSKKARLQIIESDPLGVVQYGDVSKFSVAEKLQLIKALEIEAEKTGYLNYRDEKGFAGLITQDMLPHLKNMLTKKEYTNPHQNLLTFLLDGIRCAQPIPELKLMLIEVIRNDKYIQSVRWRALDALIKYQDFDCLLVLAGEIRVNTIEDATDELMGALLSQLFPRYIAAKDIFNYLKTTNSGSGVNIYRLFWGYEFIKSVDVTDIPLLLDDLASRGNQILHYGRYDTLYKMAGELLLKGLQNYGQSIEPERLYNWLGIGIDKEHDGYSIPEQAPKIRAWLEAHPDYYLNVLKIGLSKVEDSTQFYLVFERLWGANPPENIGFWWLEQALVAHDLLKDQCFTQAYFVFKNQNAPPYSPDFLDEWLVKHKEFKSQYQKMLSEIDWAKEHKKDRKKWEDRQQVELQARLNYFREQKNAISEGTVVPRTLHDLASAYFDHYSDVQGDTGLARLSHFLDNDQELISVARKGIINTLNRDDLPAIEEIIKLSAEGREHYIRLPFLTAIGEKCAENQNFFDSLSDELAEKAIAFWYSYGVGNQPEWVKALSLARPKLTSRVIIAYMSTMFKAKVSYIYGYYALSHDADYHEIAKLVAIPLLEKFPSKSLKDQASCLESLLKAAIYYEDVSTLLTLIHKKLKRKSLDTIQRVYLLATGLILESDQFESLVREYVTLTPERITYLTDFLYEGWHSKRATFNLTTSTIEMLIEMVMPHCTPRWPEGGGFVTKAMKDGDYVNALITRLSNQSTVESSEAITRLLSNPILADWHVNLKIAQQTQLINRREADFTHPNILEAANTFKQTTPANVGDLVAIALDVLDELQRDMHTTDTNIYRPFWNEKARSLTEPKFENSCREYIAEMFKVRLPALGVEVNSEALAAENKRTDIRLIYREKQKRLSLPIEIKRNSHDALWQAIHQQLIPLYTTDPDTQGRGIYLVLWFGELYSKPAKDGGKKPKSAQELQARLIATMTPQEQKLIDVYVLDVSKPS